MEAETPTAATESVDSESRTRRGLGLCVLLLAVVGLALARPYIVGALSDGRGIKMDAEIERIAGLLRTTPPTCVSGFRLSPAELPEPRDDDCKSVWRLACPCGNDRGRVLGYPLRDFKADYNGPECFVSPLGFECSACGKVTEIIDTDVHGYHSEVAKIEGGVGSAKIRGRGPRRPFPCSRCGAQVFGAIVGFVYWDAAFDLFLEEPERPAQEFFNAFLCYGRCVACGSVSAPTDFGKL